MSEEEKSVSGMVEDNTVDYLEAIKTLKQTTVDRSEYDKVKTENKKLLQSLVNGQVVDVQKEVVDRDLLIRDLRKELFCPTQDLSNLDYISKAIQLREALIENGEEDPFLPIGSHITPTRDDYDKAAHVAEVFKDCIENSNGNSERFTADLMSRTKEVLPTNARKR